MFYVSFMLEVPKYDFGDGSYTLQLQAFRPVKVLFLNTKSYFSLKFRDAVADRDREGREPKKSISMGQIQQTGNQPSSGQIQV